MGTNEERRTANGGKRRAQSIAILGRQPALGVAELECLYGADAVRPFGDAACFVDRDACAIDFDRLGGSVRLCNVLLRLPSSDWRDIEKLLVDQAPQHAAKIDGKLTFGLSVYGLNVPPKKIAATALRMKKAIKNAGKSVRMVPHTENPLGSATVLHNKLHKPDNWELVVVSDGQAAYLAQTHFIQDIDAYAARDQARPKRDAKVGMLPPKLAQIIVNLAVGETGDWGLVNGKWGGTNKPQLPTTSPQPLILDPFCGSGVILQEALLMGYDVHGTDIDPRMIEYADANLKWLAGNRKQEKGKRELQVADATKYQWEVVSKVEGRRSKVAVATETFLGQPLSKLPPPDQLDKIVGQANSVVRGFLENVAPQLKSGTRLCLAIPAWRTGVEGQKSKVEGRDIKLSTLDFRHVPVVDDLTDMEYTRIQLKHVSSRDLIYHRPDQVVARELLVLKKS